ncbi:hypothetical protein NDU88_005637 [Pleurodeles waltl]|uniref:Uncharacterized protein n=1 Tax=Pleurodeles waltl TaxID=8319 RepID=A0AAV7WYU3_PLEWA|nr:hypothetical protein NDU88_005637 [Pleurodeles waltl]
MQRPAHCLHGWAHRQPQLPLTVAASPPNGQAPLEPQTWICFTRRQSGKDPSGIVDDARAGEMELQGLTSSILAGLAMPPQIGFMNRFK